MASWHGLHASCGGIGCGSCLLVRMAAMQQAPVRQAAAGAQQQQQRSQGACRHPPAEGCMLSSREELASVSALCNAQQLGVLWLRQVPPEVCNRHAAGACLPGIINLSTSRAAARQAAICAQSTQHLHCSMYDWYNKHRYRCAWLPCSRHCPGIRGFPGELNPASKTFML